MLRIVGLLAALGSPLSRADQQQPYQDADDFFLADAPAVLTATRLKQPLASAPAAVTVIDKAMIKASGTKEIVELFRLVPGMQVGYRRGHLAAATYHGMSDELARGMQVLVDGHSIYNASFGGVTWDDYPLLIEDIERIEVIRGPNSATYGPNSFWG
nr:Plug domain-containing protein [Methylomarinum sp. Ch1-1]MDP4522630.1 Plug domain-containing protein [Methylomarinum sp. Ch1-1]